MAYIGYKKAASTAVVSKTLATMTGDGSDTTLTLSVTPGSVNNVCVCLDGVVQCPGLHFTLATNVITFATAPANGVEVIALTGGGEHIGSPMAGSIKSADLGVGAVTSSKIANMDAAKLTGTYPALDASAVTGLTSANLTGTFGALNASAVTGLTSANLTGTLPAISGAALTNVPSPFTESASDPAANTNPAGGLGTIWVNTTSGEMFACTDATTDANVWTNIGGGTGDITPFTPGSFGGQGGGTSYGYRAGGYYPWVGIEQDKYSYASATTTATAVANLYSACYNACACQSDTAGFTMGGSNNRPESVHNGKMVQKQTFASNTMTYLGEHLDVFHENGGTGTNSNTHAYCMGGNAPTNTSIQNEKMSFATEAAFANVGDMYDNGSSQGLSNGSPHASYTHGYRAGGHGPPQTDKIEKFAFATDGNSVVGGSLFRGIDTGIAGASSSTHGYLMGGHGPGENEIDKFSFASDSDSTDVGDLHTGEGYPSGTSSTTHGYMAGGGHPQINNIQRVSFSADGNATDVGDLTVARAYVHGFQD